MVQKSESSEGETISSGIWTTQLYEHIGYFNSHNDLREIKVVLPFGIPRERKPKNYEKQKIKELEKEASPVTMRRIASSKLGSFYYNPKAEIEPWKPRLKPVEESNDQIKNKPTLFVLRHDPADKKVMYLEQDLMAKPISEQIDKQTGFSYRLDKEKNVVVRKYLAMVSKKTLIDLVKEFVTECNRVLFLYCDTR